MPVLFHVVSPVHDAILFAMLRKQTGHLRMGNAECSFVRAGWAHKRHAGRWCFSAAILCRFPTAKDLLKVTMRLAVTTHLDGPLAHSQPNSAAMLRCMILCELNSRECCALATRELLVWQVGPIEFDVLGCMVAGLRHREFCFTSCECFAAKLACSSGRCSSSLGWPSCIVWDSIFSPHSNSDRATILI